MLVAVLVTALLALPVVRVYAQSNEGMHFIDDLLIDAQLREYIQENLITNVSDQHDEYNSIQLQYERLMTLSNILQPTQNARMASIMPRINMVSPDFETGVFMVGLDIDYGDLTYGDSEQILALINQRVATETIDFISEFTGIPEYNLDIGFVV